MDATKGNHPKLKCKSSSLDHGGNEDTNVKKKLSSKIDKKALLFLRKMARKNKKEVIRSPKKKVNDDLLQESSLSSVSAELSLSLVSLLTESKINEILEKCDVTFEKITDKYIINGSWDNIIKAKDILDEMKKTIMQNEENMSSRDSEEKIYSTKETDFNEEEDVEDSTDGNFDTGSEVNEDSKNHPLNTIDVIKDERLEEDPILDDNVHIPTPNNDAVFVPDDIVPIDHIDPNDTMITITPNRGQVHRILNKFPNLATEICEHCGYKSSKEGVTRHKQRRHPKVVYKCQVCTAAFGIRYDMRRHRMNHFDKSGKLNVKGQTLWNTFHPDSDANLVNYQHFEENFNVVVKAEKDDFEATEQLYQNKTLKKEKMSDTQKDDTCQKKKEKLRYPPKDTSKAECPVCNKTYPKKVLAVHMRIHEDKEFIPCEYCGMEFQERGKLNAHVKAKHHKGFICVICGIGLSGKTALNNHLEGVHGDDVSCRFCSKRFSTSISLAQHIKREHQGQRNFRCNVCERAFFDKRTLSNHKITHYDDVTKESFKRYACSYCDKKFLQKHIMKMHENTHTGNKPYKCKHCPKAFPYLSMLHKHFKDHSDVRNFACSYCHKAFKFRYKLRHHMILHTKERTNACSVCGKCFTTSTTLRLHNCTGKVNLPQLLMEREGKVVEINVNTKEGKHILQQCNEIQATEEDRTMYVCGFCDQVFDNAVDINTHLLTHQEVKVVVPDSKVQNHVSIVDQTFIDPQGSELIIEEASDNNVEPTWRLENPDTHVQEEHILVDGSGQTSMLVEESEQTVYIDPSQEKMNENMIVTSNSDGIEFVIQINPEYKSENIVDTETDESEGGKMVEIT